MRKLSVELEKSIIDSYNAVPEHIREDIVEAGVWARDTLRDHEGLGHQFYVVSNGSDGMVVCSFAKPEWAGDHCSRPMESGSEAIVMAVCEYLNGA